MKFERTKESRSQRPRLTADVLHVRPTEEGAVDIRREVQGSLRKAWEEYVVGLYEWGETSSDSASDLYQATAFLRALTKNSGAEWKPPKHWKKKFANRGKRCIRNIDQDLRDGVSFGRSGKSVNSYDDMRLQGILQTFPELRAQVPLSNRAVMGIGRKIITDISSVGYLDEWDPVDGVKHEYALAVLRPEQRNFIIRKNNEKEFTPEACYDAITKGFVRRAYGAHILAMLRLLEPGKQTSILQLWTPDFQKEVEEQLATESAHSLGSLEYAFALMVMQAEDAQLVDGEVVLRLPPKLTPKEPIPTRAQL